MAVVTQAGKRERRAEWVRKGLHVLGQRVDLVDYAGATEQILDWAAHGEARYVCHSNVHMVMEGHDDAAFRKIVNDADLVTADGRPLVYALQLLGAENASHVRGPCLMPILLEEAARRRIPVGLLGGTDETLQLLRVKLAETYPNLEVAYVCSPPFRTLTPEEDRAMVAAIVASGARILFVGLGCPKQERWMAEHSKDIDAVLVGSGAAFDYLAGTQREAPLWMQKHALEWVFRLILEPRRLWKRYLFHNPRFLALMTAQILRRYAARTSLAKSPSAAE